MADNTLTIELEGDVTLADFAHSVMHFNRLVTELSNEVAGDADIEWYIDDLQAGSALATITGIHADGAVVQTVIQAYEKVGEALQTYRPIPFSRAVEREATAISSLIDGKITAVRFQTARADFVVYSEFTPDLKPSAKPHTSFGTVKGRVQTLSSRGKLKFTLYDSIFDKSITCYLNSGQEETMKDVWGKLVTVTGYVTRDPDTGRAKTVRNITDIEPIRLVVPGSYQRARGALSWITGEPAELLIRQLRDDG